MKLRYRQCLFQFLGVLAGATFLGLTVNALSPKGIAISRPLPLADIDSRYLTADQAKARFDAGATLFLDARKKEEYAAGHLAGAINLPVHDFENQFIAVGKFLPKEVEIIVYCRGSDCNESRQLADRLPALGYGNVKIFHGGWKEWKARGWPVE